MNADPKPDPTEPKPASKPEQKSVTPCEACGGKLVANGKLESTKFDGRLPDGRTYKVIHRTRMQCEDCNLIRVDRSYK